MKALQRQIPPYLLLSTVCIGIFFAALDQTVIYGALPDIMIDLRMPVTKIDQAAWIVTGYLLGYTIAMPLVGRISDVYGHRRIYILSMVVFIVGSILVASGTSFNWVVGARILQATGGGAVVPIAMAITAEVFPANRRAAALGVIGAAVEAGGALGPFYGGVIANFVSWRWIFWINVPIGIVVILAIYYSARSRPRTDSHVDYAGGLLIAMALAMLSFGLSRQPGQLQATAVMTGFLLGSLLFWALFVYREVTSLEPLFKLALFRGASFSAANTANLLVGGALIVAMVTVPLMTDTVMGFPPLEGGLRLLRLTVMIPIGAVVGGLLCQRVGYRLPTILGLLSSSAAFFLMNRWPLDIADPALTLHLAICGLGFGLVIAPITTAALNSAPAGQRGVAAALVTMMRMVGMIVGLSALSSWGMGQFRVLATGMSLQHIVDSPEALIMPVLGLFQDFFLAGAITCLLAIVPVFWIKPNGAQFNETPGR